jgi:hypothetical protein
MNKKGVQLMKETYLAVILAILVSVILIAFYDLETGKFSAFLKDVTGNSNVDELVALCNNLVSRDARYEYCCAEREVRYEDNEIKTEQMTCHELSTKSFGSEIEKMECRNRNKRIC